MTARASNADPTVHQMDMPSSFNADAKDRMAAQRDGLRVQIKQWGCRLIADGFDREWVNEQVADLIDETGVAQ